MQKSMLLSKRLVGEQLRMRLQGEKNYTSKEEDIVRALRSAYVAAIEKKERFKVLENLYRFAAEETFDELKGEQQSISRDSKKHDSLGAIISSIESIFFRKSG